MQNQEQSQNQNTKKYVLQIANEEGHTTTVEMDLDTAVEGVISAVEKTSNSVYIDSVPFHFVGSKLRSEQNISELRTRLANAESTEVFLTGTLRGG
jgi:hypothetical protein